MEITNLEREALLEKINKQVDDMASNIASAVYVKVHELIVEAAQEIADAEQLTNSPVNTVRKGARSLRPQPTRESCTPRCARRMTTHFDTRSSMSSSSARPATSSRTSRATSARQVPGLAPWRLSPRPDIIGHTNKTTNPRRLS